MTRSEKLRELMTAGRVLLPTQIHRGLAHAPGEYRDRFRSAELAMQ